MYHHESAPLGLDPADFGEPTPETRAVFDELVKEVVPISDYLDIYRPDLVYYPLGGADKLVTSVSLRLGTSIDPDQETGRPGMTGFVELQSADGHYVINSLPDESEEHEAADFNLTEERQEARGKILEALADRTDAKAAWIRQAVYVLALPDFLRMCEAEDLIAGCQDPIWRSQLQTGRVSFWNGTVAELRLKLALLESATVEPVHSVSTRLTIQDLYGREHRYSKTANGAEQFHGIGGPDKDLHQEWLAARRAGVYDITEGKLRLMIRLLEDARVSGEAGSDL